MADRNELLVRIKAKDEATPVLAKLRGEFDRISGVAGTALRALGPLGAVLGGLTFGGAVAGLARLVGQIDDLADTAEGLGVTAVALDELRSKAQEAGVGAQDLDAGLARLNKRLADAKAGSKEAAAAFTAIGLDPAKLDGTEEALRGIADAFSGYANTAEKSALAQEFFGRSGAKFVAYLSQGSDGLRQFTGLTAEAVEENGKLQAEIDKLSTNFQRLTNSVLSAVIPAVNQLIDKLKEVKALEFTGFPEPGTGGDFKWYLGGVQDATDATRGLRAEAESLQRFLAGGAATRRADGRTVAPTVGDGKNEKAKAQATAELRQVTDDYAASLRRAREIERERIGVEELNAFAEANKKLQAEIGRVNDLTGRSAANQLVRDLALIDDYFFAGKISVEEYDAAIKKVTGSTEELTEATKDTNDFARELGLTFSSAFEDAIVFGKKFSEVLKGLGDDIVRIFARKFVTEPLANAIGGIDFGKVLSSLFGGSGETVEKRANGGPVLAGRAYLVGERGPELFMPANSGRIVPGAGSTVQLNVVNNGPPMRAEAQQRQTPTGVIVDLVLREVEADVRRGGRVAGAMQSQFGLNRAVGLAR